MGKHNLEIIACGCRMKTCGAFEPFSDSGIYSSEIMFVGSDSNKDKRKQ